MANIINKLFNLIGNINNSSATHTPINTFKEIVVPPRTEPVPESLIDDPAYKHGNENAAFFKNGALYNVYPRNSAVGLDEDRGKAYNARFIVSDGVKYDLEDAESIKQIKIPIFSRINGMPYVTRDMGYLLRMCAANELRTELTVPLVYKAVSLMMASPIEFQKNDYFRIIAHLWTLGEIEYGDYILEEVSERIPGIMLRKLPNEKEDYYKRQNWINKYYAALEYREMIKIFPDKAPKSLEGYIRMKNNNSNNYQKLVKLATENGIKIK